MACFTGQRSSDPRQVADSTPNMLSVREVILRRQFDALKNEGSLQIQHRSLI
jgi:hypothetical protein